jgi:hypothetical protein
MPSTEAIRATSGVEASDLRWCLAQGPHAGNIRELTYFTWPVFMAACMLLKNGKLYVHNAALHAA